MRKLTITIAAIFLLGFVGCEVAYHNTVDEVTITVTDKERVVNSDGETTTSKYLVYSDGETFENTDALFFGKWNSSDIYGKLHQDSTYTMKVVGWRVPFLSMYRNIIEIK